MTELSHDPLIGKLLDDKYEIIELIGTGGWSRVYKSRNNGFKNGETEEFVAIKVLHSHLLFDQESVTRFEREARSGAELSHPNICRVSDFNRLESGQPYIVMEYLEGESLSALLRKKLRLDFREAIPIFIECCKGLEAAHNQGIVHRDVKPANIFLIENGNGSSSVKLLDFGTAKIIVGSHPDLTQTGTAFGTVQYMSPEQALGEKVDGRSDLYSLGCVMYETLTGKKVFDGRTAFSVMEQHVRANPKRFKSVETNLSIPETVESIVLKTLSKDRLKRFDTAADMAENLKESLQSQVKEPAKGITGFINDLVSRLVRKFS